MIKLIKMAHFFTTPRKILLTILNVWLALFCLRTSFPTETVQVAALFAKKLATSCKVILITSHCTHLYKFYTKIEVEKNGYSLVEVLIAVAILMLSIVGPLTIAAKSLQSAQYARQQNTAFFLAQEGISAINTLRNNAGLAHTANAAVDEWSWASPTGSLEECFQPGGCNLYFDATQSLESTILDCGVEDCTLMLDEAASRRSPYQTGVSSGNPTPFKRVITLQAFPSPSEEILVTSRVEWGSTLLGGNQVITLSTSLFNLYE